VVNADDFGASPGINRGIVRAHRDGPVTSTSLMVNMPAVDEAVAMASDLPALSLGLHVNLTGEGEPFVALEDEIGCRDEARRQLDRFVDLTGGPPTHLDSHHNVHLTIGHFGESLAALAEELGVPLRNRSNIPYVSEFYGQWDGETHPEQVSLASLERIILERATGPVTELSCHPGEVDPSFVSTYHRERELELRTLCDPSFPRFLSEHDIELVGFGSFRSWGSAST
jgi:predicted glycoside hydrolase/deacetylase ChbG (UPF0249 family)